MQSKWMCIVDYNLARIADVKLMSDYARSRYGLKTILIRANPRAVDFEIADLVLDLNPLHSDFAEQASLGLGDLRSQIVAVFPFSDNSVVSGSLLAERLGLKTDCSKLADRAFSKLAYRQAESTIAEQLNREDIMAPAVMSISSVEELRNFIAKHGEAILKPSCEGNNRGVIRLSANDDLQRAFAEVEEYLNLGLIAEQVITFMQEYSFDGVGHLNFCTRKLGVTGRYPVECGQIVTAQLGTNEQAAITRAGNWANTLVGQKIGPFHNEIKFDPFTCKTAVVEPNRRPAGMRIWHLAEQAFGVNFFHLWVDQLVTGELPPALPDAKVTAGIRMLEAGRSGIICFPTGSKEKTAELISKVSREFLSSRAPNAPELKIFDFQWNTQTGAKSHAEPADNSQFVAQIIMAVNDPSHNYDLATDLHLFANLWSRHFSSWVGIPSRLESGLRPGAAI